MRPETDQQWEAATKFIASMAAGFQADSDEVAKLAFSIQEACSPEQYNAYMDAVDVDLTDLLPALKAPTIVLHIPNMILATYEDARDIATRIKDARFVEYNPAHTFRTLFDFLRETKATEAATYTGPTATASFRHGSWTYCASSPSARATSRSPMSS